MRGSGPRALRPAVPPSPASRGSRRAASSRLRRSLRASTAEGVCAELVGAFSGGLVLTGWAIELGLSPALVAMLGALPFTAHLFQLPGAFLTSRFGSRRVALTAVAVSRQLFLPLVALPWLPLSQPAAQKLLLGIAFAHHALSIVCNNAWTAWMAELVPDRLRGRYFGARTAVCTVANGVAALAAGRALDAAQEASAARIALAALALLACVAGGASTVLMARQHSRAARRVPLRRALESAASPARHPRGRRLLAFSFAWSAAVGLAGPFFTIHLVTDLRGGYSAGALYAVGLAVARVASAPLWGRAVDRAGPRAVLILCSLGLALTPVVWLLAAPGRLWPIALDAVLGGTFAAGHALAMFALPLAVAPRPQRPFWHAGFAVAGGAGYAVASAIAGAFAGSPLAAALGGPARFVLTLSAVARLAGAGVAAVVEDEPVVREVPKKREAAVAASSALGLVGPMSLRRSPRGDPGGGRSRAAVNRDDEARGWRWSLRRVSGGK
jgi:MFS family permease